MPPLPHVSRSPLVGGAVLTTVAGTSAGPTLALLGGVHGDEDAGVLAVSLVIERVAGHPLRGTLRAVAPAHAAAWAAESRVSPLDGQNLARSFPGSRDAGPTAAVAATLTEQVIKGADALVDLHSAGARYQMPLLCGYCEETDPNGRSRELAEAFGAPIVWRHPQSAPGRSLTAAASMGIPAVYAECSGGGTIQAEDLETYVNGTISVMAELGMLSSAFRLAGSPITHVTGDGDLDSGAQGSSAGWFVSSLRAGEVVKDGDQIGRIYDFNASLLHVVKAVRGGMVMFLRHQARIAEGDVLYVLASPDAEEDE